MRDDILPTASFDDPGVNDMAALLRDFGGDLWDIVRQDDGRLGARPRNGQARPGCPFILFADTPAEMRELLSGASARALSSRFGAVQHLPLADLAAIIAPPLTASGLVITPLKSRGDEIMELVISNPRFPAEGRVIIDPTGIIDWDWRYQPFDAASVRKIASVIVCILARD
jgi:hypothetical protein